MAGDFAAELESVARELRRQADGELFRELTGAMRRGVEPAQDAVREDLKPHLPDRYAETLDADLRLGVNVRTNERDPGVSVTGQARTKARKLRNLDEGRLTHPVFGNREEWRTQEEQPGWFTGPAEAGGPRVRAGIERALADVADKAVKGG